MLTYHTILTWGIAGILGCTGLLTSCTSLHLKKETVQLPTSINLDRTTHFVSGTGEDTLVPPGTYEVSSEQTKLLLWSETTNQPLLLDAQQTTHEENGHRSNAPFLLRTRRPTHHYVAATKWKSP